YLEFRYCCWFKLAIVLVLSQTWQPCVTRFCIPSSHHIREFHYVNLKMNWTNAQNYCREKYTDLASIESTNHIKRLTTPYLDTEIAWIGLRDDPDAWKSNMGNSINSWRWSVTREPSTTGYQNWVFANPNNLFSAEYCVIMDIAGAWLDTRCGFLKFFVCYNGKKRFLLMNFSLLTYPDNL
uniref:C-type lectin domain-containing protein n=1 Tax=Amphiprion ocellaris TaxID=80972 RepID=A0AAQ6AL49_AMPOC